MKQSLAYASSVMFTGTWNPARRVLRRATPTVLAALFALAACGGEDSGDDGGLREGAGSTIGAGQPGQPADGGGTSARTQGDADHVEITIGGSTALAGTYRAEGQLECFNMGGMWGAGMDIDQQRGLTLVNAMVQDVPAGGGQTQRAMLQLTFGQLDDMSGESGGIMIAGAADGGNGTGSVERVDGGAVIRIEGRSLDNAPVTAVLRCSSVQ
jgi:hypothetical protein